MSERRWDDGGGSRFLRRDELHPFPHLLRPSSYQGQRKERCQPSSLGSVFVHMWVHLNVVGCTCTCVGVVRGQPQLLYLKHHPPHCF